MSDAYVLTRATIRSRGYARRSMLGGARAAAIFLVLSLVLPTALAVPATSGPLTGDQLASRDADGDGYLDVVEARAGSDPASASSTPLTAALDAADAALLASLPTVLAGLDSAQRNATAGAHTGVLAARDALQRGRAASALGVATLSEALATASDPAVDALPEGAERESLEFAIAAVDTTLADAAIDIGLVFDGADGALDPAGENAPELVAGAFGFARTTLIDAVATASAALDAAVGADGLLASAAVFVYSSELGSGLIGDADGSGVPVQGAYLDLDHDGAPEADGTEEVSITDTDQDAFSDRLEFFVGTDPADYDSRVLVPHLGEWATTLHLTFANASMLSDGAIRANLTLQRILGEMNASGTPLTDVVVTAPSGFTLDKMQLSDHPAGFVIVGQGVWDDDADLAGRSYVHLIGVRNVSSLYDTFSFPLRNETTAPEGRAFFDVRACDGPKYFITCTEGENITPSFLVDASGPLFAFDAVGPTLPTLTCATALLSWKNVSADAVAYAVSTSPSIPAGAWSATPPPSIALAGPDGVKTIYAAVRDAASNVRVASDTIGLDTAPPTPLLTPTLPASGWFNVSTTLTLNADDGAQPAAGVKMARLDLNGVAGVPGLPPLQLALPEGSSTVAYQVEDLLNNTRTGTGTYRVDTVAPNVTVALSAPTGVWLPDAPTITIAATDALSGLKSLRTQTAVDGVAGAWTTIVPGSSATLEADGIIVVRYDAEDVAGNHQTGEVGPIKVDRKLPVTAVLDDFPLAGASELTLRWTPSGVGGPSNFSAWRVYEKRGAAAWQLLHQTSDFSARELNVTDLVDGELRSWRVDAVSVAGRTSTGTSISTSVDLGAPDVEPVFTGTTNVVDGFVWRTGGSPTFTVRVHDATNVSGAYGVTPVDGTPRSWAVNGADPVNGNLPRPLFESKSTIGLWNVSDAAGHTSKAATTAFGVDTVKPVLTTAVSAPQGSGSAFAPPLTFDLSATDATSGVASIAYSLDGVSWVAADSLVLTQPGTYTLRARAKDVAGHETLAPARAIDLATLDATLVSPPLVRVVESLGGALVLGDSPATVRVVVDGTAYTKPATGTTWTLTLPQRLADGEHSIVVEVSDQAGRASVPRAYTVRVDGTPPTLTAILPAITNATSARLEVSTNEALAGPAIVERITENGPVSLGELVVPGALDIAITSDGPNVIRVRGADAAGNPTNATRTIVRDSVAPQVAILSPPQMRLAQVAKLEFAASDANAIALRLVVLRDDGETFVSNNASLNVTLVSTTRRLAYLFEATDIAGNVGRLSGSITVLAPDAPVLTTSLQGTAGAAGWFRSNVTARLTADPADATIVAASHLAGTPTPALAATRTLALNGTGRHVIEARATVVRDGIAIDSQDAPVNVPIDLTAPAVEVLAPTGTVGYGTRVAVVARTTDAGSGVASVTALVERNGVIYPRALIEQIPLAEEAPTRYSALVGPFAATDTVRIAIRAVDAAGHTTLTPARVIPLGDVTPPLVILTSPGEVATGVVPLTASVKDSSGISALSFELDGAPLAGATWDTRPVPNGPHAITAIATDASGNVGTDERVVTVRNAPVVGPLLFTPSSNVLPVPTSNVVLELAASAAGGRTPTARMFARVAGASGFDELVVTRTCDASGCVFRAPFPGPFPASSTLEAYATVRDGPAVTRAPTSGVVSVEVKLPVDAPLASWSGAAAARVTDAAGNVATGALDIAEAAVIRRAGSTTFASTMRAPFDPLLNAEYVVELQGSGRTVPYTLRLAPDGTWSSPEGTTLSTDTSEFRLRIPNGRLASDLGGAIPGDLNVSFRTQAEGSGFSAASIADATAPRPLDLVDPQVTTLALASGARNQTIKLQVAASDNAGAPATRVLPTLDGVALPDVSAPGGLLDIGVLDGGVLEVLVIAVDSVGNRIQTTAVFDLVDLEPPLAVATALGGTDGFEGGTFVLSGDGSRDNVGVATYVWHLDADSVPDAVGRRVEASFTSPGIYTVRLVVADLTGNIALASLALNVLDITPPNVTLISPPDGSVRRPGIVDIEVAAEDALTAYVRVDAGLPLAMVPTGAPGRWHVPVLLGEGLHTIDPRAEDAFNNLGVLVAPATVVVDGTPPRVSLAFSGAYAGAPSFLTALIDENVGIASLTWTFGDGTTLTCALECATAPHVYASAGTYTVKLRAVDLAGFAAETTATVSVGVAPPPSTTDPTASTPPPVATTPPPPPPCTVSRADIVGPRRVTVFEAASFAPASSSACPFSHTWSFGDGSSAMGTYVSHAWASPGFYSVSLTVASGIVSATSSVTVEVVPGPVAPPPAAFHLAIAGPSVAYVGESAPFLAVGDSRYPLAGYAWTFGDGATAAGPEVAHAWQSPGQYQILVVANAEGATGSAAMVVDVRSRDSGTLCVPTTFVSAPTAKIVQSPARITLAASCGAFTFWRIGDGPWNAGRDVVVQGDGPVEIFYYAEGPGGREPTQSLALDLDGGAPVIHKVESSPRANSTRLQVEIEDTHLDAVTARIVLKDGSVRTITLERVEGNTFVANVTDLEPDMTYNLTILAQDRLGRETQLERTFTTGADAAPEVCSVFNGKVACAIDDREPMVPLPTWLAAVALVLAAFALAWYRRRA